MTKRNLVAALKAVLKGKLIFLAILLESKIFAYDLYKHTFTASVLTYWYYYDAMKHAYISHIYIDDKYGVVIVYFAVVLLHLFEFFSHVQQQRSFNEYELLRKAPISAKKAKQQARKLIINAELHRVYVLIMLLQLIAFTLVIKNHTFDPLSTGPQNASHRAVHWSFLCMLAGLSFVSKLLMSNFLKKAHYFRWWLLKAALFCFGAHQLGIWAFRNPSWCTSDMCGLMFRFGTLCCECFLVVLTVI
eukprot:TRINITY_DN876_c0_g1_i5.p2 TRINITY_DN876_c0_g1~~TRINITY_DN876_c0_g1_i5.p2  ORF type:complete len:246 (-),score=26.20 TRINITY_DN876_c0_g1_i5:2114-2851(-)